MPNFQSKTGLPLKCRIYNLIKRTPGLGFYFRRRNERRIKKRLEIEDRIEKAILALDKSILSYSDLRVIFSRFVTSSLDPEQEYMREMMMNFFHPNGSGLGIKKLRFERVSSTSWEIYDENLDRWRKALITIHHMPVKMGDSIDLESPETYLIIRESQNKAENTLMRIKGIQEKGEDCEWFDELTPDIIREVRQKIMGKYGTTCVVSYETIRDILAEIEESEFAKAMGEPISELALLPDNDD